MQLEHEQRTRVLSSLVSYEHLKRRNICQVIADMQTSYGVYSDKLGLDALKTEDDIKKWIGFDQVDVLTVQEVLNLPINPHLLLWSILSEEVLSAAIIHTLSTGYCEDFLERLVKQSFMLDYRFEKLLEVKKNWIANKSSLGELKAAERKALEIYKDSMESKNEKIIASAHAIYSVTSNDSIQSIKGVFKATERVFDVKKETVRRLSYLQNMLSVERR